MRKIVAASLAAALLAAACSSTEDEQVATVGGVPISLSEVTALVEVDDTLPIDTTFREVLYRVVAMEVLEQGLDADFGADLDETAVEEQHTQFMAEIDQAGLDPASATQIPIAGEGMVRFNARLYVLRDTVVENLATDPDNVQALVDDPLATTTVCMRHILVATEEEAEEVLSRLGDGEEFATVADEVSLDTGSAGGDLGCGVANRFVDPFALAAVDAPLGELTGPVQTEFGFHVMIVDERTAPTAEEVTADPMAYLSDATAADLWGGWFNEKLSNAEVEVEPRYGTWAESGFGIDPPEEE